MKIVHVEDYFLPDLGYQINIVPKYQAYQGHDVTIVTSTVQGIKKPSAEFFGIDNIEKRDKEYEATTGVKIIRVAPFTKKLISSRIIQSNDFFYQIKKLEPEIIYSHGNDTLTGIRLALKYKSLNCPIVFDSHMLSMASTNSYNKLFYKFYKRLITPIIVKNSIPVIRTQNDEFVQESLGIPLSQCPWISYGSDTLLFHPDKNVKEKFRRENDISGDDFVIIYTGKLDESKGGKLLAQAFERRFSSERNVVLVVVGNTTGSYGKEVEIIFNKSENRIIRFPTQKYMDLSQFYQAADLSVFPKQCSLSFYDAQACGLPVVSEDNNINVERLQHNNGLSFKADNINDFREKILKFINMNINEYEKVSSSALKFIKDNYNYEDIARQYTKILEDVYKNFKKGRV